MRYIFKKIVSLSTLVTSGNIRFDNTLLISHGGRYKETVPFKLTGYSKVFIAHRQVCAMLSAEQCERLGIPYVVAVAKNDLRSAQWLENKNVTIISSYMDMKAIIKAAQESGCDAIFPGWGFLSERADFSALCQENNIVFLGPNERTKRLLGDKAASKQLAFQKGVPVSQALLPPTDGNISPEMISKYFQRSDYPLILKAIHGGGGKGQRVVSAPEDLERQYNETLLEAQNVYGKDRAQLLCERFIEKAHHIEVQFIADKDGNVVAFPPRDCSVQRRNQKVIELGRPVNLSSETSQKLMEAAEKLISGTGYVGVGTTEFLVNADNEKDIVFLEVNARLQVEYPATEEVCVGRSRFSGNKTGFYLIEALLRVCNGEKLPTFFPQEIQADSFSIHLRVCAEDADFNPTFGILQDIEWPSPSDNVRVESALLPGETISSEYDSMIAKITVRDEKWENAVEKAIEMLKTFHLSSQTVKTNVPGLLTILMSDSFQKGRFTTRELDLNPDYRMPFIRKTFSDNVDGLGVYHASLAAGLIRHPGVNKTIPFPIVTVDPQPLLDAIEKAKGEGSLAPVRVNWKALSRNEVLQNIRSYVESNGPLMTLLDPRDGQQSALANRILLSDVAMMLRYVDTVFGDRLLSVEIDGGAIPDTATRFLGERGGFRSNVMNTLLKVQLSQMLERGANAVAYSNVPENLLDPVIKHFCQHIQLIRIFDALNDLDNLKLSSDLVKKYNGISEVAISYTTDDMDTPEQEKKYTQSYWFKLIDQIMKEIKPDIFAIKDMASQLESESVTAIVQYIRKTYPEAIIHLHAHNNSTIAPDVIKAFVKAGGHIFDVVSDAYGDTHAPISEVRDALQNTFDLNWDILKAYSTLNAQIRSQYAPIEQEGLGPEETLLSKMPGGQWPSLKIQARENGLFNNEHDKPALLVAYRVARFLMGSVPLVTPSSKVAGDMAIALLKSEVYGEILQKMETDLSRKPTAYEIFGVLNGMLTQNPRLIPWPLSVQQYFRGELGKPPFGYPSFAEALFKSGKMTPLKKLPAKELPPFDFESAARRLKKEIGSNITETDVLYFGMFGEAYLDVLKNFVKYGPVSLELTPRDYFFGLKNKGDTLIARVEDTLIPIQLVDKTETQDLQGGKTLSVILKLNEKTRTYIFDFKPKAQGDKQLGAPFNGVVERLDISDGAVVKKGSPLYVLSVMKMSMEIRAPQDMVIQKVCVKMGSFIEKDQLVAILE